MTTSNMSLNEPSVGVTAGPTWATETNANWELLDAHDHTSGKGVQLTPSALNINSDMEFNQNSATELKNAVLDNDIHASSSGDTNYSVYSYGANLYWRNGSGTAVQITNGASLNSTGGAITSPTTNSQVLFSSSGNSYTFKYDKTQTDGIAKMIHSDLQLYFYNSGSATTRSVNLKYLGSGTGSNTLTVPDETGTLLSTASSVSDISVTSTTASKPDVVFANNANDPTGPFLNLKNLRGGSNAGVANDDCGTIQFYGNDAANNNQVYAKVVAEVSDPTSGGEEGKLSLFVAEYDGNNTAGLVLTGSSNNGDVDVTIGAGGTGIVTVLGILDLGDRNITSVGDIELDSLTAEGSTITISSGWTAASQTCANLGTVTTVDINGGSVDGITLGTNSAVTEAQVDNINLNTNTIKSTSGGLTVQAYEAMLLRVNDGDNCIQLYADGSVEFYGDVDINGGTLAGFTIDGSWTAASQTCANLGTVTTADINGGTWQGTIDGSWTAASQTCANLGTVTTADINGGSVDGITLGTNSAVTEAQVDNINLNLNTIKSTSGGLTVQAYEAMLLKCNNGDNGIQIYADGSVEFYGDVDINGGTIDGITLGTADPVTQAQIDNINLNLNTIKSTSGGLTVQAYEAMLLKCNNGDNGIQIYADGNTEFYGDLLCDAPTFKSQTGTLTVQSYSNMLLKVNDGDNNLQLYANGNAEFYGTVSKASGSFKIDHPLENKSETHNLVHSFIEGPQADLIYRGKVTLIDGEATVNIDTVSNMTEGTFSALCTSIQCFTTNEHGWTPIKGSVTGNILTITANDESCNDEISWIVIGERKDKHMLETEWTDENGKVIVEPEKVLENA